MSNNKYNSDTYSNKELINNKHNIINSKLNIDCSITEKKLKLDNIHKQLDDYYYELKDRLIKLINNNTFEEDIEFFLIKMFKLDDKEDTDFNVISYIQQLKLLNDELYNKHNNICNAEVFSSLINKLEKVGSKAKKLEDENELYKSKINKLTSDLETAISNNTKFSNKESENNEFNPKPPNLNDFLTFNNSKNEHKVELSRPLLNKNSSSILKNSTNNISINTINNLNNYNNLNTNRSNNKNYMTNTNNIDTSFRSNNINNYSNFNKNNINYSVQNSNNTNMSNNRINNLTYNNLMSNNNNNPSFKKLNFTLKSNFDNSNSSKSNTNLTSSLLVNTGQRNKNINKVNNLYSGNTDMLTSKMMIDQLQYSTTNKLNKSIKKNTRDLSGNSKVQRKVRLVYI